MIVSVCICTWNRAKSLALTLASLAEVEVPPGQPWEVIVCDNNCTDGTSGVVARFTRLLPIRRVVEALQGLSHARNRAVAAARGDLIIFIDDDIRVSRGWLLAIAQAARQHPEAAFFGGPISPLYVSSPPSWVTPEAEFKLCALLGALDLGPTDLRIVSMEHTPWGAHMGFRRTVLGDSPFDPKLGLVGNRLTEGEDTDLVRRLIDSDHVGWYVSQARVHHAFDPRHLTLPYIWRRNWGIGRTRVRVCGGPWGLRANVWRVGRAISAMGTFAVARAAGNAARWLTAYIRMASVLGGLWEAVVSSADTYGRRRHSDNSGT